MLYNTELYMFKKKKSATVSKPKTKTFVACGVQSIWNNKRGRAWFVPGWEDQEAKRVVCERM